MSNDINALEEAVLLFGGAPTIDEMARRGLKDKGIAGPTAAHVIEEIHAPLNLAYLTFTTGSSAFQNIVGVAHTEIEGRSRVGAEIFRRLGVVAGDGMLVTYPPLVNVFSAAALRDYGITWDFLVRSSRDAFTVSMCKNKPRLVIGESSFLRVALQQAADLGFKSQFPEECILLTAGTPLDQDLLPVAEAFGYEVHDLYGCQEFGWLALDGVPLRDDISLAPSPLGGEYRELIVGGLPMGDSFLISEAGHVCNREGKIITYRRKRTHPEFDVFVEATTVGSKETVERAARTILRIKSRIVRVSETVEIGAPATRLVLRPSHQVPGQEAVGDFEITGPDLTEMFDCLVGAQVELQTSEKKDPTWIKRR
ncbi:acyl carrier protein [Rhodobacteraceae bacterium RKSG542]|uniref:acyl carrier protein n=1 Tax=Pseudovibrio flavus TaxID=2529854 RepID=UPI0012BD5A49|nr:acyl carrier protein [Pseudovibrio flavus]MTI16852.1 acyl carrier protein [Pseudovibrio flavus]